MIPSPIDTARAFDRILRTHIAPHEYAEAVRMNAEDPAYSADSGCCASHDFCDANMTMLEAFASVTGKGRMKSSVSLAGTVRIPIRTANGSSHGMRRLTHGGRCPRIPRSFRRVPK